MRPGAMIAGLLVALVLGLLFCPRADAWRVARAVAWCTVATGFGGSMTYGQTVGLTHDAPLVGNWAALRWGLLGLAIKGGLWIGFAGVFLGMGLGGDRYRVRELFFAWLSGHEHKYDDVRGEGFFGQTRRSRGAYPKVDL